MKEFVGHREVLDELGSPLLGTTDVGAGLGSDVCTSIRLVGGAQRPDDGTELRHLLDRDPKGSIRRMISSRERPASL